MISLITDLARHFPGQVGAKASPVDLSSAGRSGEASPRRLPSRLIISLDIRALVAKAPPYTPTTKHSIYLCAEIGKRIIATYSARDNSSGCVLNGLSARPGDVIEFYETDRLFHRHIISQSDQKLVLALDKDDSNTTCVTNVQVRPWSPQR